MKASKVKTLLKHAAEISTIIYEKLIDEEGFGGIMNLPITIVNADDWNGFMDSITIRIPDIRTLEWKILEPLSAYAVAKKLTWSVDIQDGADENESSHLSIEISIN